MKNEKKGSRGYGIILNALQDPASLPCRRKWEEDVGPLDGETWSLCLVSAPVVSVSASQKLSHLYLLHRAYRTPVKLHSWGLRDIPLCPKCMRDHGDLMHMFLKCPKLFRYWTEILEVISQVFTFVIPRTPTVCLLGALDEETLTPSTHTAIIRLLYVVQKLIAQFWIIPRVPTRQQWIDRVNKMLIREKLTYQHRNAPRKF